MAWFIFFYYNSHYGYMNALNNSIDLEEKLKCNMGRAKEDACMLEKIINNKP